MLLVFELFRGLEGFGYIYSRNEVLEALSAWTFDIRAFLGFRGLGLEALGGFGCLDFCCGFGGFPI